MPVTFRWDRSSAWNSSPLALYLLKAEPDGWNWVDVRVRNFGAHASSNALVRVNLREALARLGSIRSVKTLVASSDGAEEECYPLNSDRIFCSGPTCARGRKNGSNSGLLKAPRLIFGLTWKSTSDSWPAAQT